MGGPSALLHLLLFFVAHTLTAFSFKSLPQSQSLNIQRRAYQLIGSCLDSLYCLYPNLPHGSRFCAFLSRLLPPMKTPAWRWIFTTIEAAPSDSANQLSKPTVRSQLVRLCHRKQQHQGLYKRDKAPSRTSRVRIFRPSLSPLFSPLFCMVRSSFTTGGVHFLWIGRNKRTTKTSPPFFRKNPISTGKKTTASTAKSRNTPIFLWTYTPICVIIYVANTRSRCCRHVLSRHR